MVQSNNKKTAFLVAFGFLMQGYSNNWTEVENGLSEVEVKAGWQLLFDGADQQAHWARGYDNQQSDWTVEDNAMKTPDSYHWLMSKDQFSDFEISLSWKINQGGNSGIVWHVVPEIGDYCSGPEYGILDEVNGGDRNAMSKAPGEEDMPVKITASVYDIYVTKENGDINGAFVSPAYPFGEWNQGIIWADGSHHEHWLNDQKVVDYIIGSEDWETRFQRSKFYNDCRDNGRDQYGKHPTGHFGLQAHGAGLFAWYKNLKIRPFTTGEQLVTPSLTLNESGATASVTMEVAVTGAAIHFTLDGSDPDENSPMYTEPLEFSASTTVKAVTVRQNFQTSEVERLDVLATPVIGLPQIFKSYSGNTKVFDISGSLQELGPESPKPAAGFFIGVKENGKTVMEPSVR